MQDEQALKGESSIDTVLQKSIEEPKPADVLAEKAENFVERQGTAGLADFWVLAVRDCPEGVSPAAWRVYLNELMEAFRHRETEGFAEKLSELILNEDVDEVIRDYALQHSLLIEQAELLRLDAEGDLNPSRVDSFVARSLGLLEELDAHETPFGTLLLAVTSISERLEAGQAGRIDKAFEGTLIDVVSGGRETSIANRVSAIQAASRLRLEAVAPLLSEIAYSESESVRERLSAIASLREFPEFVDAERLQQVTRRNQRLTLVAHELLAALEKTEPEFE